MKKPAPSKLARSSVSRIVLAADGDCSPSSTVSQGCWQTLPELMPINPIHLGLMHNGKVLVLTGSGNSTMDFDEHIYQAAVWDPANPDPNTRMKVLPNLKYDLWCNGMAFLPDGRALIVGGTEQYDPFHGSAKASIFNPLTEQFIQVQSMQHGRWYATVTALGDGKLLAFSGLNETTGLANTLIEDYRIGTTGWTPHSNPASWSPIPLYPWLHLLPDGRIFYSGYTNDSRFYDPVAQTWSDPAIPTIFSQPFGRVYGSSVLLPLLAPLYTPRVMNLGGENNFNGNPTSLDPATNTTEVIDPSAASPVWTAGPNMSVPRVHMNAVLLPTGRLLALGGSTIGETPDAPGTGGYLADLIDPSVDPMTVASAGVAAFARLYHSMALLLPDATVLVVGSNPARDVYEDQMEIYSPAYLFTDNGGTAVPAVRPQILSAPSIIGYGATFDIQVDNAADILAGGSVVLMRPGSPTHAYDMEQRMIKLTIAAGPVGAITVTGPPATGANGANIAPPGYYMLFVLNGAGVPSVANFIQLSLTPTNQPPVGSITSPATDVTILPGQQVTFAGSGSDSDGTVTSFSWLFPDAAPGESSVQNPGAVTFPSLGTYVVSLTVTDNSGANDPNPPTRTVTVASSIPATLTISKTGTGGGTVASNPTGIDCGGDCTEVYNSGTLVTLTATADAGSVFTGWSGGSCSGTGDCMTTVNSNTTVTANFDTIPPTATLTITKTGAGGGTVASNPTGIDCGGDCSEVYNSGTLVTLTVTADAGSVFTGWSGGSCSGTGNCETTVSSNTTVTANFDVVPPPPLVLATSPLPDAEVGVSYVAPLVSSGLAPYTTTIIKGKLPPGLNPDPSGNGTLIGTPAPSLGANFTVQVTQSGGAPVNGSFKVKVLRALGIATNILRTGIHGQAYNKTLRPKGGKAPYSWSLVAGSLPVGLTLTSAGVITGVIDSSATLGVYNLTVEVTDPIKATDPSSPPVQKSFTLTVK